MEEEFDILEDIKIFANLTPRLKLAWIITTPERTVFMVDYLINITKDG